MKKIIFALMFLLIPTTSFATEGNFGIDKKLIDLEKEEVESIDEHNGITETERYIIKQNKDGKILSIELKENKRPTLIEGRRDVKKALIDSNLLDEKAEESYVNEDDEFYNEYIFYKSVGNGILSEVNPVEVKVGKVDEDGRTEGLIYYKTTDFKDDFNEENTKGLPKDNETLKADVDKALLNSEYKINYYKIKDFTVSVKRVDQIGTEVLEEKDKYTTDVYDINAEIPNKSDFNIKYDGINKKILRVYGGDIQKAMEEEELERKKEEDLSQKPQENTEEEEKSISDDEGFLGMIMRTIQQFIEKVKTLFNKEV